MADVSGFGAIVKLVADKTFPSGVALTQFSDDADPFDFPAIDVNETAMGVNGDLITWSRATPLPLTLNFIPDSEDDVNLAILLEANRAARGKTSAKDKITISVAYPSGKLVTLSGGVIVSGVPSSSLAGSGRLKTKPYTFNFENKSVAQ